MMQTTKQAEKVILRDNVLKKVIHAELYKTLRKMVSEKFNARWKAFFSADWIAFSFNGEKGYWNSSKHFAIPVQNRYEKLVEKYFEIGYSVINDKQTQFLFGKGCPSEIMNGIKASKAYQKTHWVGFNGGSYCVETGQYANWNDGDSVQVGGAYIQTADFVKAIVSEKYKVVSDDVFKKAVEILKERNIYKVEEKDIDKLVTVFGIDRKTTEKEITAKVMDNFIMTSEIASLYTDGLLSCDTVRADLEKYDTKCLEDVNLGHWELWTDGTPAPKKGQVLASLEKPLVARNPASDIHYDGLIGIDFGTKSTIVSKQDGKEKTTLLRIGIGQLAKEAEQKHYENPTIMEFINLEKFISDYKSRNGRPETRIDDLRVSHSADRDLQSCTESDYFYSFFYDIKQWCGDTERSIKIIDQHQAERVLPAFVALGKDDFDPLELYAYYLGLYINNMRNGIYLDYILSFPVTYEKAVKEKILASFTKGLKKSLPESIQNDKEIMGKFRVRQGVSEPAAYAITALQGYGFEPDEDENIFYAIFDFGGGTTDFDFGLWRCSADTREEERYDYVIEHFGSEGDKYLGGENLLELMAFEIFKANARLLQKGKPKKGDSSEERSQAGFSFSKPNECDEFPGSETLISNSQEARRNTKQLMEVLRPFWEGIIGIEEKSEPKKAEKAESKKKAEQVPAESKTKTYKGYIFRDDDFVKFPIDDGALTVDLFDKDGRRQSSYKLYVENQKENISVNLIEILEKRIERGVSSFFDSVMLAFANKQAENSGAEEINIFLAGNSSKSPILKKLFNKYISKTNEEIGKSGSKGEYFKLFPPLGTEEAFALQRKKHMKVNESDISAPTGKTGVAYGLISGREGGTIKVISEIKADSETKFRYNIGKARRGKFQMVLDRNEAVYNQWIRFIDAGVEDFEIYYTSLPGAGKMSADDSAVHKKRCRLPYTDDSADVYIRPVSPEDIEFCVAGDEPDDNAKTVRVHLGE